MACYTNTYRVDYAEDTVANLDQKSEEYKKVKKRYEINSVGLVRKRMTKCFVIAREFEEKIVGERSDIEEQKGSCFR